MVVSIIDEEEIISGKIRNVKAVCPDGVYTLHIELTNGKEYERFFGTDEKAGNELHNVYGFIRQEMMNKAGVVRLWFPCETAYRDGRFYLK